MNERSRTSTWLRRLAVLKPIKLTLTNLALGEVLDTRRTIAHRRRDTSCPEIRRFVHMAVRRDQAIATAFRF